MKITNLGKKLAAFLAAFVLLFGLAGCLEEGTGKITLEKAQEEVNEVLVRQTFSEQQLAECTKSFALSHANGMYPEVKIEWSSSVEDIIEVVENADGTLTAKVNRPKTTDSRVDANTNSVAVELSVVCSRQSTDGQVASGTRKFVFHVTAVDSETLTINQVKTAVVQSLKDRDVAMNANDSKNAVNYTIYGRILAHNPGQSMFVSDGTGTIVVYGKDYKETDYPVGQLVKVVGDVYSYYGNVEFGSNIDIEKLPETDSHADITVNQYVEKSVKEYTDELIAAQTADKKVLDVNTLTLFSGATYTLYVKVLEEAAAPGDAFALEDAINGTKISLYHYCTDGANTERMRAFVGKYVSIQVITFDRYSSNDCFRVVWNGVDPVEKGAPVLDDAQALAQAKTLVEAHNFASKYFNGDSIEFPAISVAGVTIEWAVTPAGLYVDNAFVVTEAGTATITATITVGELSETVEKVVAVAPQIVYSTVAEAYTATQEVYVKGLVSAVYARGFVLYDETGSILVYKGSAADVAVGDYVLVTGTSSVYPTNSKNYQIAPTNIEKLTESTTLVLPAVQTWTATELDAAWAQIVAGTVALPGNRVQMEINLVIDGKYINATIAGSTQSLSISYPTDDVKALIGAGGNATVVAVPISYSLSSGSPKYFNFIVLSVEKAALTDEEQAQAKLDELTVPGMVEADFELPAVEGVEWSVAANEVAVLAGNQVTVTRGETNTTVVFTATATVNAAVKTKEFNVVVKGTEIVAEKTIVLTPATFNTFEYLTLNNVVENTSHTDEFTCKGNGSITSLRLSGVTKVVADVYGTYDNMKMYAGANASGTLVAGTNTTEGATNGKLYTYEFAAPVNEFHFVNSSTYQVHFYSITVYYTGDVIELTDEQKAQNALDELEVNGNATDNFVLPAGAEWSMKEASAAATLEGNNVTVTRGAEDVTVVFVASVTVGTATLTKEFSVVVKAATASGTTTHTMVYTGATTTNMTGNNDAATVGLDATLFSVVGANNGNTNFPGLNKAGQIRLYGGKGTQLTSIEVSVSTGTIVSITITFAQNAEIAQVLVDSSEVTGNSGMYDINAASFTIKNNNPSTASSYAQVWITSIEIVVAA